jgi:hypothetical protein
MNLGLSDSLKKTLSQILKLPKDPKLKIIKL